MTSPGFLATFDSFQHVLRLLFFFPILIFLLITSGCGEAQEYRAAVYRGTVVLGRQGPSIDQVIDVGDCDAGRRTQQVICFQNVTSKPISMSEVEISCECLTIADGPSIIGPKETELGTLTLDLSSVPEFFGYLRIEVTVRGDSLLKPETFIVVANVRENTSNSASAVIPEPIELH